ARVIDRYPLLPTFPTRRSSDLLDTDAGTPAEIAASLADLCRINRWFGGINTSEALIERVARRHGVCELSLLEIAAGSGGVPNLRSEEHTSELQSREKLVCRLLL